MAASRPYMELLISILGHFLISGAIFDLKNQFLGSEKLRFRSSKHFFDLRIAFLKNLGVF